MGIVGRECRPGVGRYRLAERPRHVAKMGQRAREVAVLDVEMKILVTPAADRLHEVRKVLPVLTAIPLSEFVTVVVEGHARCVVRADHEALGAIDHGRGLFEWVRDLEAERGRRLHRQAADVGDQDRIVPLEDRHLTVGHVAVVHVAEPAAEAHNPLGQLLFADRPAALVEFVRILVAEVAIARDLVPVPVVVEPLADRDLLRCRAGPEVEVEARWDRGRRVHEADALPQSETDRVGRVHSPNLSRLHELHHLPGARHTPALHAHLAHAAEFAGPLGHHPALLHVVAAGLLDVDVFARLHRPHGHQGMPVVGRGD